MEVLKTQINVLREIVFHCPIAHIAFLSHKPYHKLYYTKGGQTELANKIASWHAVEWHDDACYDVFWDKPDFSWIYNPLCPSFFNVFVDIQNATFFEVICNCHAFNILKQKIVDIKRKEHCFHSINEKITKDELRKILYLIEFIKKHHDLPLDYNESAYFPFVQLNVPPTLERAFPH